MRLQFENMFSRWVKISEASCKNQDVELCWNVKRSKTLMQRVSVAVGVRDVFG